MLLVLRVWFSMLLLAPAIMVDAAPCWWEVSSNVSGGLLLPWGYCWAI